LEENEERFGILPNNLEEDDEGFEYEESIFLKK